MDGQTDGGDYNIPFAFLKKRGDNQAQLLFVKFLLSGFKRINISKRKTFYYAQRYVFQAFR